MDMWVRVSCIAPCKRSDQSLLLVTESRTRRSAALFGTPGVMNATTVQLSTDGGKHWAPWYPGHYISPSTGCVRQSLASVVASSTSLLDTATLFPRQSALRCCAEMAATGERDDTALPTCSTAPLPDVHASTASNQNASSTLPKSQQFTPTVTVLDFHAVHAGTRLLRCATGRTVFTTLATRAARPRASRRPCTRTTAPSTAGKQAVMAAVHPPNGQCLWPSRFDRCQCHSRAPRAVWEPTASGCTPVAPRHCHKTWGVAWS